LRTLLIGALAASLVGCSRQPSPQLASGSCTGTNGFACLERTAGPLITLATFRVNSTATNTQSASTRKTEKSSSAHVRHGVRLASKAAKSTTIAAKAQPPTSRVPLPPGSPKTQLQTAGNAAAAESKTTVANIAEPHPTVGPSNFKTRMIEAQVAAATALAERKTVATAAPVPDMKPNDRDRSSGLETLARGNTEKAESASPNDTDLMVAVLMARPDIKSVSDLTSKTIAIDERHSASNRIVRTALVAAGAPEVQLSEGQATAINRLVNGEVSAAVLALVSADAAEGFSEIPGFKIFHIPLSPRSLKARP
jgi:hypothetical protein